MAGFGSQPFGSTPYGLGQATVPDVQGGRVYRDPLTGNALGARKIDPRTRDYVMDEHGRYVGMSSTLQLVQIALSTEKASSAMRELGHELGTIETITSNIQRRVETTLTEAISHITARGLIEVLGVEMFKAGPDDGLNPGAVHARFRFRDLTTGEEEQVDV